MQTFVDFCIVVVAVVITKVKNNLLFLGGLSEEFSFMLKDVVITLALSQHKFDLEC